MKHRCLILLALVLALATSARAQVPELDPLSAALAEPALPSWEGDAGTLRIRYGSETLFEGAVQVRASEAEEFRAAKPGELVFTPAQTTGERTQQFWKIEAAPDSGLSELFLSGELRTSAEGLAAETRGAAQARLPLVRTSVGPSRNLRNNAVYDRHWDWLFGGPSGATRIRMSKRDSDALHFHFEVRGPAIELSFLPLWFQQHRNLPHYKPWTYKVFKDSVGGWCSWWA